MKQLNFKIFLLVFLFVLQVPLLQANMDHFSFSEPGTGKKTASYEVEITFAQNNQRQFRIPHDCEIILREDSFGLSAPNNTLDRALWQKMINDCHYVVFVHQSHEQPPLKDFVSNYDFFNAKLEDLPFQSKCTENATVEDCRKAPNTKGKIKLSLFFPFLDIRDYQGEVVEDCRFINGAFRGSLILTDEGIHCHYDRRGKGLRLISVDHGDFNDDGYQDALLRMIPMGRGVSRMPILLPLTRFEADQPFTLPEGLTIQYFNQ